MARHGKQPILMVNLTLLEPMPAPDRASGAWGYGFDGAGELLLLELGS